MPSPEAAATAGHALESASLAGTAIQITLSLLLILGVILAGFYVLKKYGPRIGFRQRGKPDVVTFVGHLPLGPKQGVAVVKFAGRMLVLGVTEHSINLLTETYESDQSGDGKGFEESLRRADGAGGGAS